MRLRIALPTRLVYDGEVSKVKSEAVDGAFVLLPRHIDFVTALVPGILSFDSVGEDRQEMFFAVDVGILVKSGRDVWVSTRNAVRSGDLRTLHDTVRKHFGVLDEQESRARSALIRLEADFVRRYLELGDRAYE
jgi:F-type H+-transporting ATPase subunit epsilon